jgi:hypothetical protein
MDTYPNEDGTDADRYTADQLSVWDAFVMVIWSIGILLRTVSTYISRWSRRAGASSMSNTQPSTQHESSSNLNRAPPSRASSSPVQDQPVFFFNHEAQQASPLSIDRGIVRIPMSAPSISLPMELNELVL